MVNSISYIQKQQIIELFLCSNDKRLKVIAQIVGASESTVSDIIQKYYDKNIEFDRGNFIIYHSEINKF